MNMHTFNLPLMAKEIPAAYTHTARMVKHYQRQAQFGAYSKNAVGSCAFGTSVSPAKRISEHDKG